jgi:hypothetical protein
MLDDGTTIKLESEGYEVQVPDQRSSKLLQVGIDNGARRALIPLENSRGTS